MRIEYVDYSGPSGLFIADGHEVLALTSTAGAIKLVGSCVHAGIGDPEHAAQAQALIDAALTDATSSAA